MLEIINIFIGLVLWILWDFLWNGAKKDDFLSRNFNIITFFYTIIQDNSTLKDFFNRKSSLYFH